jgi:hypothetical protein
MGWYAEEDGMSVPAGMDPASLLGAPKALLP